MGALNPLLQMVHMVVFPEFQRKKIHKFLRNLRIIGTPAIRALTFPVHNHAPEFRTYFRIKPVECYALYSGIFMHTKYIYYIYGNTLVFSGIIRPHSYGGSCFPAETAHFYACPCFRQRKERRKNAEGLDCDPFGAVWYILLKKHVFYCLRNTAICGLPAAERNGNRSHRSLSPPLLR